MLTVLSVSYPLAEVTRDAAGGAEQILSTLDRALVEAGHCSLVVAPSGSQVAGELCPVLLPPSPFDDAAKHLAQERTRAAIGSVLQRHRVDVVHCHGLDFAEYLPSADVPVLATLHLPLEWYGSEALRPARPDTWLNCVSRTQHEACAPHPRLLGPVPNGVAVEALQARVSKRDFALVLGRICPEKNVHVAIEAARDAGLCIVIAGRVYPYAEHQAYFDAMIRPKLGRHCHFVGPVGFERKRRLLTAARCLLVPSSAPETSSLVAREAAACGTPTIAFPVGAMAEAIEQGRTGFLVRDQAGMSSAIRGAAALDPEVCRAVARQRFSDRSMIAAYLELYSRLARRGSGLPS